MSVSLRGPRARRNAGLTGPLTLGNHLGALRRFAEQPGRYVVADLHALTTPHEPDRLRTLTRDLALRFNHRYGPTFTVPRTVRAPVAARIGDLAHPRLKMSKSGPVDAGGVIRMLHGPDVIRRKIMRAVTDSRNRVAYDPVEQPGVSNLVESLAVCTGRSVEAVAESYDSYAALKQDTADAVVAELEPVQERYAGLSTHPDHVDTLLADGARRAGAQAAAVLERARTAMGL